MQHPIHLSLIFGNRNGPSTGFLKVPGGGPLALHFDKNVRVLNLCQGIQRSTFRRTNISVICLLGPGTVWHPILPGARIHWDRRG